MERFLLIISITFNLVFVAWYMRQRQKRYMKAAKEKKAYNVAAAVNPPVCYYCINDTVKLVDLNDAPITAPEVDKLIVSPGTYNIEGQSVNFDKEGLYRMMFPLRKNFQTIVHKDNLDALLSAIAWVVTHGNSDNTLNFEQLCEKAKGDKLYLTCGFVSPFVKQLLTNCGYKARVVSGISLADSNNYDSAHVMVEVFHPTLNKWVLVDIDNNYLFTDNSGTVLNLIEFRKALEDNTVQLKVIAKDIHTDVSGYKNKYNYSFNFQMELFQSEAMQMAWYKRVMDHVLIEDHFCDSRNIEEVKKYSDKHVYLETSQFNNQFYN